MRIIKKIILLLVTLTLLNWVYSETLFLPFVEEEAEQWLQVDKIKNCDLIYVSASSNFPPSHINERDPRKISQFIGDHLTETHIEAINKPASHSGVYRRLLELFPEDAEAKSFVITMNLRSFGPTWIHSELETPLNKSNVFYNNRPPLFNRFLVSLNAYDDRSSDERMKIVHDMWEHDQLPYEAPQNTVNAWCAVEKWGDWTNPKRQLADQFIKQYGFVINEDNPRVMDFDHICELAEERGYTIYFNLIAENVDRAEELAGQDLRSLMRSNADWLIERYTKRGFIVIDNLELLADSNFTDRDFPTEHYDEAGRKAIAKSVANAVKNN